MCRTLRLVPRSPSNVRSMPMCPICGGVSGEIHPLCSRVFSRKEACRDDFRQALRSLARRDRDALCSEYDAANTVQRMIRVLTSALRIVDSGEAPYARGTLDLIKLEFDLIENPDLPSAG